MLPGVLGEQWREGVKTCIIAVSRVRIDHLSLADGNERSLPLSTAIG
jgi:hypothetical protein